MFSWSRQDPHHLPVIPAKSTACPPLCSHSNCPLPLYLPFASFTMHLCHRPQPSTCLNVSQTFSVPHSYILRASSSITPQPPFTCPSLSHPSSGSHIPHPTKFCPHSGHNLSSICAPPTSNLLVSGYFCPNASPYVSFSFCACLCFPSSFISSSSLSLLPYLIPRPIFLPFLFSCLPIQWLSSFSPTAQSGEPV